MEKRLIPLITKEFLQFLYLFYFFAFSNGSFYWLFLFVYFCVFCGCLSYFLFVKAH